MGLVAVRKKHRRWSLENECGPGALSNGGKGLQFASYRDGKEELGSGDI